MREDELVKIFEEDLDEDAPSVYKFYDAEEDNIVYVALSSPVAEGGSVGIGVSVIDDSE